MTLRSLFVLTITAVLLAGCAGFSPLSISEATLERHLQDAVRDYDRQQLQAGSPLSLSLSNADITLGPDGRDVAVIDLSGQVALNALMARFPADIALKVEGAPVYDSQERAIYIRRLRLLESSVNTPYFSSGELAPVTENVMRVVAQMLETVPVYRLDDTSLGARLMGMANMDLRVAPGRLEFVRR